MELLCPLQLSCHVERTAYVEFDEVISDVAFNVASFGESLDQHAGVVDVSHKNGGGSDWD